MAQRILVSWLATKNDFDKNHVNTDGPTYRFHQLFWEEQGYDAHWLLHSGSDTRVEFMINALKRDFPTHSLRFINMNLQRNDVIDLEAIYPKVQKLLLEEGQGHALDLFFSTGTPVMQLSWFLCHQNLGLDTRLLQTTKPEDSPERKARLLFMNLQQAPKSECLHLKSNISLPKDKNYMLEGESLEEAYKLAQRIAAVDGLPAIIIGESGTGKEHLARWLHEQSPRAKRPFFAVNCSALSDNLLESRLFGHRKGSFTGAEDHRGLLEDAHGATLFLDEIGDISPYMQQSLLRFLEEGEITPIGENRPKKIDVRIVAATHKDLHQMCNEGTFRSDLYYRLVNVEISLPPLRFRSPAEREGLLQFFLHKKAQIFKRKKPLQLSDALHRFILQFAFPGNVRELEKLVEGLYAMCDEHADMQHLPRRMTHSQSEFSPLLEEVTRKHILKIYEQSQYNKTRAAKSLGISLNALKRHLKKYGIESD